MFDAMHQNFWLSCSAVGKETFLKKTKQNSIL
jgi:hypothetical protein